MIIITGGAGLIGSAMAWKLNQEGITDIWIVDNLNATEKWKNLVPLKYREYIHKDDFLKLVERDELPQTTTAIIHMGACSATTELDMDYLFHNNVHYTCQLAKWCADHHARFIYASSAATYGNGELGFSDMMDISPLRPINRYGYSKQFFDLWARDNDLLDKIVGLKFFNVFGPNEYHKQDMRSVVCKAYQQIFDTQRLSLFKSYLPDYADGEQMRDFVYIKDCVDVMWWLLQHPRVNGLYNVGTSHARSWNDLARAIFKALELPAQIDYIEMPEGLKRQYQYYTKADMTKLNQQGYTGSFLSLEDGVYDYVTEYLDKADRKLGD